MEKHYEHHRHSSSFWAYVLIIFGIIWLLIPHFLIIPGILMILFFPVILIIIGIIVLTKLF